ncbi:hypothetical protein EVA_06475 [gut metagenome]|uniref:Uncharacterized protein n=1 Tax=gut metagenome TaxID=749906 RepID=J9GXG2_9ZZZZ
MSTGTANRTVKMLKGSSAPGEMLRAKRSAASSRLPPTSEQPKR